MISVSDFLSAVHKNATRVRSYRLGMDGSDGTCDCIGLIIGALRLCGEKWKGTHGSNWAARNEMRSLTNVQRAEDLHAGDIVFKAREKGESGYALPSRYSTSRDQRDYYHVGVVTSANPFTITHCTGVPGGIKRDGAMGKWRYAGRLKMVDDEDNAEKTEDKNMKDNYRVTGGNLNMRSGPGKNESSILVIPDKAGVYATDSGTQGWMKATYNGKTGYCMARYLAPISEEHEGGNGEEIQSILAEIVSLAEKAQRML